MEGERNIGVGRSAKISTKKKRGEKIEIQVVFNITTETWLKEMRKCRNTKGGCKVTLLSKTKRSDCEVFGPVCRQKGLLRKGWEDSEG